MTNPVFWLVPISAIVALFLAWYFYRQMMKESEGTDTMKRIASHVRKGAMSYLKQQYKIVGIVFLCLVVLFSIMAYGFQLQNPWVPVAFLTGGFFSGLSGFLGMKTATYASARTANAARNSLNAGLRVAFRSGAVMGLVVVGLGLIDISFWYLLLDWLVDLPGTAKLAMITTTMLTFGMGASTQALFARVGGGIYTKAADVGADLVGKVEAGIPEDDPRNPATIADNVGDNVGDVAGMGADLYESYVGSILATFGPRRRRLPAGRRYRNAVQGCDCPHAYRRRWYPAVYHRHILGTHQRGCFHEESVGRSVAWHKPQFGSDCSSHIPYSVAPWYQQLVDDRLLGCNWPYSRHRNRPLNRILHLTVL